ncbi:MAG TPA: hypothetical protein VJB69_00540 [Candidatus Paceibacterota bacterium]
MNGRLANLVFNRAIQTKAYRRLLQQKKIKLSHLRDEKDFKSLPITDKSSYIYKSAYRDLFPRQQIPPMVYASSGSSGQPTFWWRGDEQEKIGGQIHERIIRDVFQIKKTDSVLAIVCFSMGIWIAGPFTADSFREVARRGYKITVATPGIEREDILSLLKNVAIHYDQIIINGYPPFIMDVIVEAQKRHFPLPPTKLKFITAGDKFSEKWRSDLMARLNLANPEAIVNIYGSADAGVMGHETPLSIFLRCQAIKNKSLYHELFGQATILPALVQYDPELIYFETIGEELVLTANTSIPLIRYNIHDLGLIKSFPEISAILKKYNLSKIAQAKGLTKFKTPVLIIKGRSDVAVTFYALNIYPENIKMCLERGKMSQYFSGKFAAYSDYTKGSKRERLHVNLELAPEVKLNSKLETWIKNEMVNGLEHTNIEFRKLRQSIGVRALPEINLLSSDSPEWGKLNRRQLVYVRGKKPKIVLPSA